MRKRGRLCEYSLWTVAAAIENATAKAITPHRGFGPGCVSG